jgi:hypothetical protein
MLKAKIRKVTQIKICKATAASMLMCGSEDWALNGSERRKTEAGEMRLVTGCALTDLEYNMQSIINICLTN